MGCLFWTLIWGVAVWPICHPTDVYWKALLGPWQIYQYWEVLGVLECSGAAEGWPGYNREAFLWRLPKEISEEGVLTLQVSHNLRWVIICLVNEHPLSSYFIFIISHSFSKIAWTSEPITTKSQRGSSKPDEAEHLQHRMLFWGSRGTVASPDVSLKKSQSCLSPFPHGCLQNSFLTRNWHFYSLFSCCPQSALGNCLQHVCDNTR